MLICMRRIWAAQLWQDCCPMPTRAWYIRRKTVFGRDAGRQRERPSTPRPRSVISVRRIGNYRITSRSRRRLCCCQEGKISAQMLRIVWPQRCDSKLKNAQGGRISGRPYCADMNPARTQEGPICVGGTVFLVAAILRSCTISMMRFREQVLSYARPIILHQDPV